MTGIAVTRMQPGMAHGRAPRFAPDESGEYSSTNYLLLGLALQKAHGLARWQEVEGLLLEMLPEEARLVVCAAWDSGGYPPKPFPLL